MDALRILIPLAKLFAPFVVSSAGLAVNAGLYKSGKISKTVHVIFMVICILGILVGLLYVGAIAFTFATYDWINE